MSGDKAVKDIARRITAETGEEFSRHLREVWGKKSADGRRIFNHYIRSWESAQQDQQRGQKVPKYEGHLKMIEDLERSVLISAVSSRS